MNNNKNLIKELCLLTLLFLFVVPTIGQAQTASSILDKAAATYDKSGGMTASFTSVTSRTSSSSVVDRTKGQIDMKGSKFVLKSSSLVIWYNGQTQWSYVAQNQEVNVSEPSGDELQMTNPTLLIRSYKTDFTAKLLGDVTASNGKTAYNILLVPRKRGQIQKVELQIEKYSSLPVSATIVSKNDMTTVINISHLRTGANQPDSFFVFNKKEYPKAEIIDLR